MTVDMKILDTEVTAVLVKLEGCRYLRMSAPTISKECLELKRTYIWYSMSPTGWEAVWGQDGEKEVDRLEEIYQESVLIMEYDNKPENDAKEQL